MSDSPANDTTNSNTTNQVTLTSTDTPKSITTLEVKPDAKGKPETGKTGEQKPGEPAPGDDQFKSEASKQAVLSELRKERDARQALEARINAQNEALMAAFGVTEPPKDGDDLAETVKTLQAQIATDRRTALIERLAATHGIDDEHKELLTETDPERLKVQAEKVGALVKATKTATPPPDFQPNPGQGQGGAPGTPEALLEAEYQKFYPSTST